MPRVIGIDPGTVSIDLCGLDDGRVFLDRSWPTAEALTDPARFVAQLEAAGPLDLVAGPSGYGLPLTRVQDATEEDLRLAFLAAPGETGGIGGLRDVVRALARSALPVVLTPGVVHLPTVPAHRKVNRVDMGTAEEGCAVALLAGEVSKALLFRGGAATIAGWDETTASPERLAQPATAAEQVARDALVESAVKTAVALATAVPSPKEFLLSGRLARVESLAHAIRERLEAVAPTRLLEGVARTVKERAQGAALIADGLAGGANRELVERLAIREAQGSVLDHLYVVPREHARRRLGLS